MSKMENYKIITILSLILLAGYILAVLIVEAM